MWEYKIHRFERVVWRGSKLFAITPPSDIRTACQVEESVEDWLNKVGKEGWELVSMNAEMHHYFFKRNVIVIKPPVVKASPRRKVTK